MNHKHKMDALYTSGKMENVECADIFVSIQEELRPVLRRQFAQNAE